MLPLRRQSLVSGVCAELSNRYVRGAGAEERWLPPERILAKKLGVSRTVLREAAQRLESQGLLEIRHGIGIRVANQLHRPLSVSIALLLPEEAERVRKLMDTRRLLEPHFAARAAETGTPRQFRELEKVHRTLLQSRVSEEAVGRDIDFHQEIARLAGNEILGLLLQSVSELGRDKRKLTHFHQGMERASEQHGRILAAIVSRDPEAAAAAMSEHLATATADLEAQLAKVAVGPRPPGAANDADHAAR